MDELTYIICDNEGLVENCMNFGSVTGRSTLGGIVGFAQPGSKTQNCYFNSDVFHLQLLLSVINIMCNYGMYLSVTLYIGGGDNDTVL